MDKLPIYHDKPLVGGGAVDLMRKLGMKVVIISATRTPFCAVGTDFKDVNPIDLGVFASRGAIEKAGLKGREHLIDHVIMGNAQHTSLDSHYGARHVGLKAGVPWTSRGLTVNRICWSGGEALTIAAKELITGDSKLVLAGGYESTSQSPFVIYGAAFGFPYMAGTEQYFLFKDGLKDTWANGDMMDTAENVARYYGITREEVDQLALESQQKAGKARDNGNLGREITPVELPTRRGVKLIEHDNLMRPETTIAILSRMLPVKTNGVTTAGNCSGIVDGGAAMILTTEEYANELGLKPIGEFVSWSVSGVDPRYMGIGPVPAMRDALARVDLTLDDIDNVEINEAFGAQYMAVEKVLGIDRKKLNKWGGAIALGHPLGATAVRLTGALIHQGGMGISSACIGGGQGGALVVKSYLDKVKI
ncbi:MAG: thiolase family protein [bacterium]|nr:thiolase family protein [bacterium]